MKKYTLLFCLLISCGLLNSSVWGAVAPVPKVVASIKPIHALVAGVMQSVGEPQLLVKGGGSPHGYVLRPSEARALAQADLIIWIGHQLESFLEKPLATLASESRQLELSEVLRNELLPLRTGGSWDVHAHKDAHQAHAAEQLNPHLWLNPQLAKLIVAHTASELSAIDPERQKTYQRNAEHLQQRLDELDRQIRAKLAPVKDLPYVVFHDAYQYFEVAYGLNPVGSITVDPERKPGVKRLLEMRQKVKALDARCVFSEPQFEPKLVATIIEGTGARTGELDPVGAELEPGVESYFQLMDILTEDLLEGLR